jgi:hypothetical protein
MQLMFLSSFYSRQEYKKYGPLDMSLFLVPRVGVDHGGRSLNYSVNRSEAGHRQSIFGVLEPHETDLLYLHI